MTDAPGPPCEPDPDPDEAERAGDTPAAEAVYEATEPLEPYTTGDLASVLGVPGRLVRSLLLLRQSSIEEFGGLFASPIDSKELLSVSSGVMDTTREYVNPDDTLCDWLGKS